MTALVDPPIAARATIALWNDLGEHVARPAVGGDHLHDQPAGRVRAAPAAGCPRPESRRCRAATMPRASASSPIVDAVPMVLQCPRLRIIDDSESRNCRLGQRAGPDLLGQPPDVGAAAQRGAAERAGQHRPARHHHGRQIDRGGRHEQGGDGLVAAAEQHDAVDRVGPQHLLGRHRRHVAPQHRRRAGPASRRAKRPAGSAARRRPPTRPRFTCSATSSRWRCTASGRRPCSRSRSAGGLRTPSSAARGASRRGGCRRCGLSPAYHCALRSARGHRLSNS